MELIMYYIAAFFSGVGIAGTILHGRDWYNIGTRAHARRLVKSISLALLSIFIFTIAGLSL